MTDLGLGNAIQSFAEQFLGQSGLTDHRSESIGTNFIVDVVVSDRDDPDLISDGTSVLTMAAALTARYYGEVVPLDDRDELAKCAF